jgi:arylsulfate sulfotransferase
LLLFDNGFNRRLTTGVPGTLYSRIVAYDLNETQKTVRQAWSWGQSEGSSLYSVIISSAAQLPNTGNYLFGSGFIMSTTPLSARIVELQSSTKAKVFDAELSFKNATGNGVFGWGTIDIMYRVQSFTF